MCIHRETYALLPIGALAGVAFGPVGVYVILSLLVGVVLHELGHYVAARMAGSRALIHLMGSGGLTLLYGAHPDRSTALVFVAAGPLVGLVVAALGFAAAGPEVAGEVDPLRVFGQVTLAVSALNLLPVGQLDGAQVVWLLTRAGTSYERGRRVVLCLLPLCAAVVVVPLLLGHELVAAYAAVEVTRGTYQSFKDLRTGRLSEAAFHAAYGGEFAQADRLRNRLAMVDPVATSGVTAAIAESAMFHGAWDVADRLIGEMGAAGGHWETTKLLWRDPVAGWTQLHERYGAPGDPPAGPEELDAYQRRFLVWVTGRPLAVREELANWLLAGGEVSAAILLANQMAETSSALAPLVLAEAWAVRGDVGKARRWLDRGYRDSAMMLGFSMSAMAARARVAAVA